MQLEFLLEAEEELAAAAEFYDFTLPGLGRDFLAEVTRTCRLIARSPEAGTRLSPRLRRRLVRRFPYCIIYTQINDTVLILAVAHQRRRPEYWRQRY